MDFHYIRMVPQFQLFPCEYWTRLCWDILIIAFVFNLESLNIYLVTTMIHLSFLPVLDPSCQQIGTDYGIQQVLTYFFQGFVLLYKDKRNMNLSVITEGSVSDALNMCQWHQFRSSHVLHGIQTSPEKTCAFAAGVCSWCKSFFKKIRF